jgi:hypothetical protein
LAVTGFELAMTLVFSDGMYRFAERPARVALQSALAPRLRRREGYI